MLGGPSFVCPTILAFSTAYLTEVDATVRYAMEFDGSLQLFCSALKVIQV